jgi:histidinol-phosphate/aromatic aminotransferase/cobyric acid decarboxylase-like protein
VAQLAARLGLRTVDVPLAKGHSHDLGAMSERVDAHAGLVYICNPHNPTGRLTRRQDIDALLQRTDLPNPRTANREPATSHGAPPWRFPLTEVLR